MSEDRVRQGDLVLIQLPIRPTHQHLQRKPGANPPAPGDEALVTYQTPEGSWIQYPADAKWKWRLWVLRAHEEAIFCKVYLIDSGQVEFFDLRQMGTIVARLEEAGLTPQPVGVKVS